MRKRLSRGVDVIVEQIGGVAEQRLAARRSASGGGRVELLHVLFVCQLSGMGRLRGAGGLGRAGGAARYVPGGCLAC